MNEHPNQEIMPILMSLLREGAGITVVESDWNTSFFELGLDSLFLTQFSVSVGKRFGTTLTFRQLSSELDNLTKLAAFIGPAPGRLRPAPPAAAKVSAEATPPGWLDKLLGQSSTVQRQPDSQEIPDPLMQLLMGQLAVMQQQLQTVLLATQPGCAQTDATEATAPRSAPAAEPPAEASAQVAATAVTDARPSPVLDAARPPVPGARLGRDPSGKPAWFVPAADRSGKYVRLN